MEGSDGAIRMGSASILDVRIQQRATEEPCVPQGSSASILNVIIQLRATEEPCVPQRSSASIMDMIIQQRASEDPCVEPTMEPSRLQGKKKQPTILELWRQTPRTPP